MKHRTNVKHMYKTQDQYMTHSALLALGFKRLAPEVYYIIINVIEVWTNIGHRINTLDQYRTDV